ncbi:MAG: response regulator transcription factor [Bacteroidales bacterium]|nr:response regulator transcription factor [Bacteroidales bacterium]
MKTNKIIKVAIASNNYIYNLGIKTILSVIGIKPELFEINTTKELRNLIIERDSPIYLIINEDIFNSNLEQELYKVKNLASDCPLLLFKNNQTKICHSMACISYDENQREILRKLEDFFFSNDVNKKTESSILSERELDILKEVALGLSNKEIAEKLFISINTVITHRKNITEKLGIKTIAGLTIYAILNGIINPKQVNNN